MKTTLLALIIMLFVSEKVFTQIAAVRDLYYTQSEFSPEFCIAPATIDTILYPNYYDKSLPPDGRIYVDECKYSEHLNKILDRDLFHLSRHARSKIMIKSIPRKIREYEPEPYVAISYVTLFHFATDTMVMVELHRSNSILRDPDGFILLLRYSDGFPLMIADVAQSFRTPDDWSKKFCFGDYNNDGILDFMHYFTENMDRKITLHEFVDGRFRANPSYYIHYRWIENIFPIMLKEKSLLTIKNDKGEWEVIGNK